VGAFWEKDISEHVTASEGSARRQTAEKVAMLIELSFCRRGAARELQLTKQAETGDDYFFPPA